ncbi:hypothetical protein ACLOJK_033073 [Asimina triloba]
MQAGRGKEGAEAEQSKGGEAVRADGGEAVGEFPARRLASRAGLWDLSEDDGTGAAAALTSVDEDESESRRRGGCDAAFQSLGLGFGRDRVKRIYTTYSTRVSGLPGFGLTSARTRLDLQIEPG